MSADYNDTQVKVIEHYKCNTQIPKNRRAFENTLINPPKGKAWVRLSVIESFSKKISTCEVEEQGFIVLQVFMPLNKGLKSLKDIKSEFTNMFSHKNINGIVCYDVSQTNVGTYDNYHQHNISINYKTTREA